MSRNEYPPIRRDPITRRRLCRGCGGPIPPRKDGGEDKRKTWCSRECFELHDPDHVRSRVYARDGHKCVVCGYDFDKHPLPHRGGPEFDHILPWSEDGLTEDGNMRTLCGVCHKERTKAWHAEKARQRREARTKDFSGLPLFSDQLVAGGERGR